MKPGPNNLLALATGQRPGPRKGGRRPESIMQQQLVELLVGKARKGVGREPGAGMTGRWPELRLLYSTGGGAAGAARSIAAAGIRKAEGCIDGVPDLVLPVARWPFHGLYTEVKIEGEYPSPVQRDYLAELLAQGYAALVIDSVQQGLDVFTEYLRLPRWPNGDAEHAERNGEIDRILALTGAAIYEHDPD